MRILRRPITAASAWLVAVLAVALGGPAPAATATPTAPACAGVTVVIEFNQLGGGERTACAPRGGTAEQVFAAAGVRLAYQPGMPDFVCTVDRLPVDRPCTTSTSYWSLWWSHGDAGWTYAALGVGSLEVGKGDALGFVWHQGSAAAEPPAFPIGAAPAAGQVAQPAAPARDTAGAGTWIAIGLGVVVIGGAAAVALLRRRRG